ncbi:hypothetical protein [Halorubrum sp. CBA1125]|uniref:DUF7331 family protein n=1 Tax=Halorubrum sp. CBA1125 TaxID=2668072 RepID=UPI0018D26F9C|nr:hypothetical protein [Halorubrum sp. CBA1125]
MTPTPRSESGESRPVGPAAADAEVEAYEDDGNVVLFDATNPLAWVEASRTVQLTDAL